VARPSPKWCRPIGRSCISSNRLKGWQATQRRVDWVFVETQTSYRPHSKSLQFCADGLALSCHRSRFSWPLIGVTPCPWEVFARPYSDFADSDGLTRTIGGPNCSARGRRVKPGPRSSANCRAPTTGNPVRPVSAIRSTTDTSDAYYCTVSVKVWTAFGPTALLAVKLRL
jgi:hypothetical protein